MAELVPTIPFNFDEIYENLEILFKEKGYDSIYEGSNIAQIVTAMSYLISMLNINTAKNINEMILPLATKRKNIIQDARLLGYEPEYIKSYKYKLTLTFSEVGNYIIENHTSFTDVKTYYYIGPNIPITITQNMIDNITNTYEIDVIEGDLKLYNENPDILTITTGYILDANGLEIPQYYIDIPFKNVEHDGIFMYLNYIDGSGSYVSGEFWTRSDKFMIDKDDNFNKQFVRLDNLDYETPRCYFKLSGIGNEIRPGTIANINVLISSGINGELTKNPLCSITNCTVTNYALLSKGSSAETNESIQTNAPVFYNTASRSVTKNDYKVIAERTNSVYSAEIWGGEDEYPIVLGNLYFSFIPESLYNGALSIVRKLESIPENGEINNKLYQLRNATNTDIYFLSNEQIISTNVNSITGEIYNPGVIDEINKYKLPALKMNIRHPIYVDVYLNVNVIKYIISKSKNQIRSELFNIIDTYMKSIEEFYVEFFVSNITKRIDSELSDLSGVEVAATFKAMITSKNIQTEDLNVNTNPNGKVIIELNPPYEDMYDSTGSLIYSNLPNVNTLAFINNNELYVDFTSGVFTPGLTHKAHTVIEFNIIVKDTTVVPNKLYVSGKYKIYNLKNRFISIELDVKMNSSSTLTNTYFTSTSFNTPLYLDLKYKTSNFRFYKNAIPRLRQVSFN